MKRNTHTHIYILYYIYIYVSIYVWYMYDILFYQYNIILNCLMYQWTSELVLIQCD